MLDRVSAIIQAESDADKLQSDADTLRWQAAELIAAELADGKSQRQLARDIGKDHKHVAYMARGWQQWGPRSPAERPSFNDAYHSPQVRKPKNPKPSDDGLQHRSGPGVAEPEAEGPVNPEPLSVPIQPQEPGIPRVGDVVDALSVLTRCTERQLTAAMIQVFGADREALKVITKSIQAATSKVGA